MRYLQFRGGGKDKGKMEYILRWRPMSPRLCNESMEDDSVCITAQAAFPKKDRARVGVPGGGCSMCRETEGRTIMGLLGRQIVKYRCRGKCECNAGDRYWGLWGGRLGGINGKIPKIHQYIHVWFRYFPPVSKREPWKMSDQWYNRTRLTF